MPIKEETLTFGDVVIVCRQMSTGAQFRLQRKEKRDFEDTYIACVDKPELLDRLTIDEGLQVMKKINELNGWETKQDPTTAPPPAGSGS